MGFVFTTTKDTPLEASNIVNRSFKPLLARAEIARIRFHELRHTCASVMAKAGVARWYAQDHLGHAHVSVTMNIYTHVLPETRAEEAKKIEEAIVQPIAIRRGRVGARPFIFSTGFACKSQ